MKEFVHQSVIFRKYCKQPYKTSFRTCALNEDSDAYSRNLIRICTGRILDSQGFKAQVDLSLSWAHLSDGPFSSIASHFHFRIVFRIFLALSRFIRIASPKYIYRVQTIYLIHDIKEQIVSSEYHFFCGYQIYLI